MNAPEGGGRADAEFEQLLAEARAGSKEALGKILNAFRVVLLRKARDLVPADVRGWDSASDLVQDTFLQAQRDFHQFQGHRPADLHRWLVGILRHNFGDLIRAIRRRKKRQIDREVRLDDERVAARLRQILIDPAPSPTVQAIEHEETLLLQQALEQLPEHYRLVLYMRFGKQLSYEQIGSRLGITREAARKAVVRGLEYFHLHLPSREHPPAWDL